MAAIHPLLITLLIDEFFTYSISFSITVMLMGTTTNDACFIGFLYFPFPLCHYFMPIIIAPITIVPIMCRSFYNNAPQVPNKHLANPIASTYPYHTELSGVYLTDIVTANFPTIIAKIQVKG